MSFSAAEAQLLISLFGQLAALVEPEQEADTDPLATLVGIGTATSAPDDPGLARLFPDAYTDDPKAASEFRRYTEDTLRRRKLESARTAIRTLEPMADVATDRRRRARRELSPDEVAAWMSVLNDLRLVLGTRIDVSEDWVSQRLSLSQDDPLSQLFDLYEWLSALLEILVECSPG